MGLTMAEPCASVSTLAETENWYGVQVAPRHEKAVSTILARNRIEVFLPTMTEQHRWSDRTKKVEVPLFPGYTFARFSSAHSRIAVLRCDGVVRLVGKEWVGTPIPTEEIENLKTVVKSRVGMFPYPFLQAGDHVRIKSGALEGVEGVLLERRGERQLVLSVSLIQKSMAISIDGYSVEKIGH